MRREFEKTVLEKLADFVHRRIYWARCVLSTGHAPDPDFVVLDGRTICENCGCWVRAR